MHFPSCESVHLSTANQCLWALQPWRTKARCVCVRCAGLVPCVGSGGRVMATAPAKRTAVPAGPWQYHAVQQYSVVRRSWRQGGVAIFLNRPASTPPRILIGVFLIPPVRCMMISANGPHPSKVDWDTIMHIWQSNSRRGRYRSQWQQDNSAAISELQGFYD